MNVVVVLQKPMEKAKTRLKDFLSPNKRMGLVSAMLQDVLSVLSKTRSIDCYGVLTCDETAIQLAKRYGATVFYEEEAKGINLAIQNFVNALDEKYKKICILPSDLPLINSEEIEKILNGNSPVTIVPCNHHSGTNGLVMEPPNAMTTKFGVNSKDKHIRQAKRNGLYYELHYSRSLMHDIDTIQDVLALKEISATTYTRQYLIEQHIFENILAQGVTM